MKNTIFTLCIAASFAHHQVAFCAPTQEEIDAEKRTQAMAEAVKGTAEANKATVEAENSAARAKLGTIDLSKMSPTKAEAKALSVEGDLLAYAAVQNLAGAIAASVAKHSKDKLVVIYSESELKALQHVNAFSSNVASLSRDLANLSIPPSDMDNPQCAARANSEAGGGSLGVLGSLDVAAEVLSLFKMNKTLEGKEVSIDTFALSAAVVSELKNLGTNTIYPPLFFTGSVFGSPGSSQVEKDIDNLLRLAPRTDVLLADIARRKVEITERSKSRKKSTDTCKFALVAASAALDLLGKRAQLLKDRAAKYVTAAMAVDEKTGDTLLQSLVVAEAFRKVAAKSLILQLKPIAGGGSTLTKTSFFTSSFRFSGGAIAAYMLVDGTDGTVVASGLVGDYGGHATLDELKGVLTKKAN